MRPRSIRIAAVLAAAALPAAVPTISAQASARSKPAATAAATTTTSTTSTTPAASTTTTVARTTTTTGSPTTTSTTSVTSSSETTTRTTSAPNSGPGGVRLQVTSSSGTHAAGDPGDTISDFKFSPATITVHVGDTITWTNVGPTAHTATASDGSFDTGTLQKGQSGSHTFTTAGTIAYICTLHPFMHGTVIVQGTSTPTGGGGSSTTPSSGAGSGTSGSSSTPTASSTSTPTAAGTTAAAGPSLPNTGSDLGSVVLVGLLLMGGGLALRRRLRAG
jgi:LPXTG-motif cell wall-anchored protein